MRVLRTVHLFLGLAGSGKSTLAYSVAGHPKYTVTRGEVLLDGENVLEMAVDERARAGLFLAMQYPVEIPGVSNVQFLREALNSQRKLRGQEPLNGGEFLKLAKEKAAAARATALAVGALGLGTGTGLSLSSRCSSMTREILRPCCSVPGCCEDR